MNYFAVDLHFKIINWMLVESTPKGQIGKYLACTWVLENPASSLLVLSPPAQ